MIETGRDPIYLETSEKLKKLGVKAIFYDLDDTLIFTAEIFDRCLNEYSEKVADNTGISAEEVLKVITEIDNEEYKTLGVNPNRWHSVVSKAGDKYPGYKDAFVGNLDVLMKIYTEVPRMRPGVRVILQIIKGLGIKQGLVTHANVEWTHRKLNQLELWDFFDTVLIADENGHKGVGDWKKAMDSVEVSPDECLVLGDSLNGDIRPCDGLGARTMWIASPWSVYRAGVVPEKTIELGQISEMLAALDRLR